jgi:acyl-CoA synthetase (AMP-forming)/AMP-acid ligase II
MAGHREAVLDVVGMPVGNNGKDQRRGRITDLIHLRAHILAFIVGSVETDALDAHLLQRIARFKRPKRYIFTDELPKNSYGKVLKRELRTLTIGERPEV